MRVLIVKTSSMGDVVHALPMVSDIARAFPHVRIDWVVEEAFADIPRLHPAVTRVVPVALRRWRQQLLSPVTWRQMLDARRALRQTRYHTIIDCQGLVKSALVAWSARGPVTGFSFASAREPMAALFYRRKVTIDYWSMHAVDRNRRIGAAALGYPLDTKEQFCLRLRVAQMGAEDPLAGSRTVLLLTNASRSSKLWPDEHWSALEHALARQGMVSLLAWGSLAEQQASVQRAARMQSARVLPRSSVAQIAVLAAKASLVVGLDTGLTHLAAAVGAPTVGIFCDHDPDDVGLRGSDHILSLGGPSQVPAVADVLAAVERVQALAAPAH